LFTDHRLNGSSSPVLTATSRSYGRGHNSTLHKIQTPYPIKMKFETVDYVHEIYRQTKFRNDRPTGAAGEMGEI